MTEDQKLEYLRNKANDKADTWQFEINEKNTSFQQEEVGKLWKLMKKHPEKDLTNFKKGIIKKNASLIKEETKMNEKK